MRSMLTDDTATVDGPFNVGNIDSSDTESSFNRSLISPPCLSIIDALANTCRLASDRELAELLSDVKPVVMAASWLANDVPSPTGLANVAAAARLDNDDTPPTASDDRFVCRVNSVKVDDFSATATNISTDSQITLRLSFLANVTSIMQVKLAPLFLIWMLLKFHRNIVIITAPIFIQQSLYEILINGDDRGLSHHTALLHI